MNLAEKIREIVRLDLAKERIRQAESAEDVEEIYQEATSDIQRNERANREGDTDA